MSLDGFKTQSRARIEAALTGLLDAQPPTRVLDVARYCALGGGHRWRGMVALAAGEIFRDDADLVCMPAACAVELAHAASMLLDDLPSMDDAELRRGKKCAHLVFEPWAVDMAAAYMVNLAYTSALGDPHSGHRERVEASLAFGRAAVEMVSGQQADLTQSGTAATDEQRMLSCYRQKSGHLYGAGAAAGALLCGASESDARRLESFGVNLGISYQIFDDVADLEGDVATLGKATGMDVGKLTAPAVLGLEAAKALGQRLQDEAYADLQAFGAKADLLRSLVHHITWAPV
jgi:geranylgeranyl pyrophosphate synthase